MEQHLGAFGSGDVTSGHIRAMRFPMYGDGYDPRAVDEYLEQVASSMDVLTSTDMGLAIRRELQRSSEISSRMVLAGQEAAERLRQQAAEDARAILDDTKRIAEQLRDAARVEVQRTREHVEDIRRTFIDELRDLYDRVGATLYRFDSASRVDAIAGDPAAGMPAADEWASAPQAYESWSEPVQGYEDPGAGAYQQGAYTQAPGEYQAAQDDTGQQQSEWLEPAWTQLPADAYGEGSSLTMEPLEPSAAPSDEPEPEPLVDLRGYGAPADEPSDSAPAEAAALEPDSMGGWLDDVADDQPEAPPVEAVAAPEVSEEVPADEDARAEALIAGLDDVLSVVSDAPPELPEPPALSDTEAGDAPAPAASAASETGAAEPAYGGVDMPALHAFIVQSIHDGQSRDAIESWIQQQYGIQEAASVVDAALAAG